ncbi:hypothetical protein D3C74_410880 [compost metagenome]
MEAVAGLADFQIQRLYGQADVGDWDAVCVLSTPDGRDLGVGNDPWLRGRTCTRRRTATTRILALRRHVAYARIIVVVNSHIP